MNIVRDRSYFIHEYNFNYEKMLKLHEDKIIESYNKLNEGKEQFEHLPSYIEDFDLEEMLLNQFVGLVQENYYAGDFAINTGINVYIQDETFITPPSFHNHVNIPGNICGILYLNPPKVGGEIEFSQEPNTRVFIKPELNKIYLFPSWLYYRHTQQEDTTPRICLNFQYTSNLKPIHKVIASRW